VRRLIELDDWPTGSFVNVNFPDCAVDAVSGVRLTRQGQRPPGSFTIDARVDARNQPYFWVRIHYPEDKAPADTDLEAVADNAISVTPIKMDFTDHQWREGLGEALA
jgi:5'-nucleotidase